MCNAGRSRFNLCYNPEDQEQQQGVQQYGSACSPACQPSKFDTLGTKWIWLVIAILVIKAFMLWSSAH